MLETHISRVFLTGPYAYKVKKPVSLGFVDFTTLESRRLSCRDELDLNRRLAPALYLDVVPVRGSSAAPRLYGAGPVIDYAVKMREFPQDALASAMLARGALTARHIVDLAARLATFHADASHIAGAYGTAEAVQRTATENFVEIEALLADAADRDTTARLREWTTAAFQSVHGLLARRHAECRVREVHGDLHLGNIVCLEGRLVPFDCLEFNAALRWNDVISEVAFLVMDLEDRGAPALANRFLDAYLAASGDYEGLAVLRFFTVYRAVVRAKVHFLRAREIDERDGEHRRLEDEGRRYLLLAKKLTRPPRPAIIVMHGLSGSGKSTAAVELIERLHGVRVRSDVERKRLAGLPATASSGSPPGAGLYTARHTNATYARLVALARFIVRAGHVAIIDATGLRRAARFPFSSLASDEGVAWAILDVTAPEETLKQRIVARAAQPGEPSEATLEVLRRQLASQEPLTTEEQRHTVCVDGMAGVTTEVLFALARLGVRPADNSDI